MNINISLLWNDYGITWSWEWYLPQSSQSRNKRTRLESAWLIKWYAYEILDLVPQSTMALLTKINVIKKHLPIKLLQLNGSLIQTFGKISYYNSIANRLDFVFPHRDMDFSNKHQNLKVQIPDKVISIYQTQTHWKERAGKENVCVSFPREKVGHLFTSCLKSEYNIPTVQMLTPRPFFH